MYLEFSTLHFTRSDLRQESDMTERTRETYLGKIIRCAFNFSIISSHLHPIQFILFITKRNK